MEALASLRKESGNEESADFEEFRQENERRLAESEKRFRELELKDFLRGPYDTYPATLTVLAGAGGRDAADWAGMLFRMYHRYAERKGWKARLLHEHQAPEGGVKSATLEVDGPNAYGWLRREGGVHRLVRISPFDASKRRHTSFSMLEVLPVLPEHAAQKIELKSDELRFETARSSGPGGQNVNRRETAVRVTHLPTGIVVECQAERTQGANRERAMAILRAKLLARKEQERSEELRKERGERQEATWGSQIRSYVLHPYKLVKDHRTGVEHHDPEQVLDGDLEKFIEAELSLNE